MTDPKSTNKDGEQEGSGGPIVMRQQPRFGEVITDDEAKRQLEEETNPQAAFWGTEDGTHC